MNNLKELRIKNNISQADIARHLDVSKSLICRFEKGTKDISFSLDELAGRKKFIDRKED